MKRLKISQETKNTIIQTAVEVLERGGLVIFPTETTYGAGVDATNPEAIKKLLEYKARREGKPLSIAVTNLEMAKEYVAVNTQARNLYHQFLPGPVTVISQGLGKVAPGVESEFGTLGVRIPDYQLILEIVRKLGRPMTATSANPSDGARPYDLDKLLPTLSNNQTKMIDLILDAGHLPHNPPSTVIDTTLSTPITMRQGEIKLSTNASANAQKADVTTRHTTSQKSGMSSNNKQSGINYASTKKIVNFTKAVNDFANTSRLDDTTKSASRHSTQGIPDSADTRQSVVMTELPDNFPSQNSPDFAPDSWSEDAVGSTTSVNNFPISEKANFNPQLRQLQIILPTTSSTDDSETRLTDNSNIDATSSYLLNSSSPEETMGIAGRIVLKHWNDVRKTGLIIGLNGPLGAGKTVFAQGVAKFLGISQQLVSPTYTYIEEYQFTRHQTNGMLYHLDMWKVDSQEVFNRLDFISLLQPKNIVIVEWWEQVQSYVHTDIPVVEVLFLNQFDLSGNK